MTSYTARIELDTRAGDPHVIADALGDYDVDVRRTLHGRPEVVLTLPADNLRQAITTAMAVTAGATGFDVIALEAMPTREHQERSGLPPVPPLLSVTEAAEEIGVSPQAVRLRLEAGTLPGTKVGATWVVPAAAIGQA